MGENLGPHSGIWTPLLSASGTASPHGPRFRACTPGSACNTRTCLPAASQPCACRAASRNLHPTFFSFLATWHVCGHRCLCSGGGGLCKQVFNLPALVSPSMNQDTLRRCRLQLPAPSTITEVVPALVTMEKFKGEAWRAVSWDTFYRCFPRMRQRFHNIRWSVSCLPWYRGQRSCRQPLLAHPGNVTRCQQMRGNGNTWKYDTIGETYGCNI